MHLEDRTTIVDPLTGAERPVVGVSVAYASVVGAGGIAPCCCRSTGRHGHALQLDSRYRRRVHRLQHRVRPHRVELHRVAGRPYHAATAPRTVRNVYAARRPTTTSSCPSPHALASDAAMRDWINAYRSRGGQRQSTRRCRRRPRHQRVLGRRRLVQHQEALVPRGAAADSTRSTALASALDGAAKLAAPRKPGRPVACRRCSRRAKQAIITVCPQQHAGRPARPGARPAPTKSCRNIDVRPPRRKSRAGHRCRARHRPRDRAQARRGRRPMSR